jgi:hypothetical protein
MDTKTDDVKNIFQNVIFGWILVWVAVLLLWIKFDWVVALIAMLFVYGTLKLLSVSFLVLLKEMKANRDQY